MQLKFHPHAGSDQSTFLSQRRHRKRLQHAASQMDSFLQNGIASGYDFHHHLHLSRLTLTNLNVHYVTARYFTISTAAWIQKSDSNLILRHAAAKASRFAMYHANRPLQSISSGSLKLAAFSLFIVKCTLHIALSSLRKSMMLNRTSMS